MAISTTGGDAGVVHGCTTESTGTLMTILTSGRGSNVVTALTDSR